MSQAGYTPIQLYFSTTAAAVPVNTNLADGELAINITDGKLYYKNNGGTVTLLASTAGAAGDVVGPASATDNALARFDATTGKLIQNSVGILSDAGVLTGLTGLTSSGSITLSSLTSGRVPYASTGGLLTDSANLTFDGTTLTANALTTTSTVTINGGTANGVTYLNGSKVLTSGSALTFDGTTLSVTGPLNLAGTSTFPTSGLMLRSADNQLKVVAGSAGIAFSAASGASTYATIDSSGNLGLGVAPSAWSLIKGLQVSGNGMFGAYNNESYVSNNWVYDGAEKYIANGFSTRYTQSSGKHIWYNAPSNASGAGAALTFTQAMTLDASGRLLVGTTSTTTSSSQSGEVYSAGAVGFLLTNTTAANYALSIKNEGTSGTRAFINFYEGTSGGTSRANISFDGSNNFVFTASNATIFTNGGSERMRIANDGKVGIGTTSPNGLLQIGSGNGGGNVPTTSALQFGANNSIVTFLGANDNESIDGVIGSWNTVYNHQNAKIEFRKAANLGSLRFYTQNGSGITERFRIHSDGAFGLSGANYGTAGQVLTSGGSGVTPTWTTVSGGGGTPAGSSGQVQYNNGGAFGAISAPMSTNGTSVTFDPTSTNTLNFFRNVNNSTNGMRWFNETGGPYYYDLANYTSSPYRGLVWGDSNFTPAGWANLMSFMNMSVGIGTKAPNATLQIVGSLSKSSGSFCIDHPLPSMTATHNLVHSFVEAPDADLMYSGMVNLVNGRATVNIDTASRMTEGTFVLLCRNVRRFCSNEGGWTPIRSTVVGNILTIEAQDATCSDEIFWQVIGERCDKHMIDTGWTDEEGRVIVEPLKIRELPASQRPVTTRTTA
jgi:hypothetical protein